MKSRIVSLLFAAAASCGWAHAQVGDGAIVGAIGAGDALVSGQLNKNLATHAGILAAETAIVSQMNVIRKYEEKTYQYLSTVNGAIKNAYDITRCAALVEKIVSNLGKCSKAAADHPDRAVITGLVSDRYTDIIAESSALAAYVTSLVKKGGEKNLLNSAERNQILSSVVYRLGSINYGLVNLRYEIELARWTHVVRIDMPDWSEMARPDAAFEKAKKNITAMGRML